MAQHHDSSSIFSDNRASRPLRKQIGVGSYFATERAKQLVMETLDSNRLSAGPKTEQFESLIARAHNCHYGLMCNSGTSALQIALAALKEQYGWQDGDEVLVPALTFVATANVVLFNSMKPVFVDVEPAYYCIDPACIEKHITPRTRAVMPVHVGCLACDMDPIEEICGRRGLRIIEDSAEAMFVNYKGRPVGSFGDIAAFSTYIAHVISTGVGGLCTTNDPELLVLLKSLMNHGRILFIPESMTTPRRKGASYLKSRTDVFHSRVLAIAFARQRWKRLWVSRSMKSAIRCWRDGAKWRSF